MIRPSRSMQIEKWIGPNIEPQEISTEEEYNFRLRQRRFCQKDWNFMKIVFWFRKDSNWEKIAFSSTLDKKSLRNYSVFKHSGTVPVARELLMKDRILGLTVPRSSLRSLVDMMSKRQPPLGQIEKQQKSLTQLIIIQWRKGHSGRGCIIQPFMLNFIEKEFEEFFTFCWGSF